MKKSLGIIKFIETEVVVVDDRPYFAWPLTEDVKAKIRLLLESSDMEFGFENSLETVPRFHCPVCDAELTFFDQVREGVNSMHSPHSKERFVELLKSVNHRGNGNEHRLVCEHGHEQPVVLGWATGFEWTY